MVRQAAHKHKGKILRSLAAKAALTIRCDGKDNRVGLENRAKLEVWLRKLEGKNLGRRSGSANKGKPKVEVSDNKKMGSDGLITPAKTYNSAADSLLGQTPSKSEAEDGVEPSKNKDKKKKRRTRTGGIIKEEEEEEN